MKNRLPLNSPECSTTVQPAEKLASHSESADHHTASQQAALHNWRDALQNVPRVNRLIVDARSVVTTKFNQKIRQKTSVVPIAHRDTTPRHQAPRTIQLRPPKADNIHDKVLPTDAPTDSEPSVPTTPTSRTSLYQNLLYFINVHKPTATLPSLVDYHSRYSAWHSTRSYNLLLDLSLRHRQYGVTEHLFRSLRLNCVPFNIETHRLVVRCLVQQNMWDDAWDYVKSLQDQKLPGHQCGKIPFHIWLELCRSPKKRRKASDSEGAKLTLEEQYELLHDSSPPNIPPLSATPPFAIFCLVDLMLRLGRQATATALTEAYFKALPHSLSKQSVVNCLRIIHSHLAHCKAKPGLPKFNVTRQMLISFLRLHPSLKPNGRTLCLLFKTLQRSKRCGTIAWRYLAKFKKDWGPQVENRRVLCRVSQLALKEGRLDIIKNIQKLEVASRIHRRRRLRESKWVTTGKLRRLPYRLIYPRNGKESRMWHRHRARIRLKLLRT